MKLNFQNDRMNIKTLQKKLLIMISLMTTIVSWWDFRGRLDSACVDSSSVSSQLSFWGTYVSNAIWIPYTHPLWPNWTVKEIDFEVFQFVALAVENRITDELSSSPTYPNLEFTSNYKCLEEYKKFAWMVNFPPCDKSTDTTMHL